MCNLQSHWVFLSILGSLIYPNSWFSNSVFIRTFYTLNLCGKTRKWVHWSPIFLYVFIRCQCRLICKSFNLYATWIAMHRTHWRCFYLDCRLSMIILYLTLRTLDPMTITWTQSRFTSGGPTRREHIKCNQEKISSFNQALGEFIVKHNKTFEKLHFLAYLNKWTLLMTKNLELFNTHRLFVIINKWTNRDLR